MTKAIIPRGKIIDASGMERALENALTGVAKDVLIDFKVTTQTWKDKPTFTIERKAGYRKISTDDRIYGYVNFGTKPHLIRAKKRFLSFRGGYRAKTTPRIIGSTTGGASGKPLFAKVVHHPGTKARAFDEAIKDKWDDLFPGIIQRAITAEIQR